MTDFFPIPGNVSVASRFDNSAFDLGFRPEGGIDDFAFYSGGGGSLAGSGGKRRRGSRLGSPHPTPTCGATEIALSLPRETHVRADIYDIRGRLVATAADQRMAPGEAVLRWDGRSANGSPAASGVYWMALKAGHDARKIRLVVVR